MLTIDRREVWTKLASGVHEVARVVAKTYGPQGGKVAVWKNDAVLITTDGAALTRESQLGGEKRLGAKLVRAAAIQTEKEVGDGTSTTVLLTSALVREIGRLAVVPDWDPVQAVSELQASFCVAEKWIRSKSIPTDNESLLRISSMATHEDPLIATKVVEAVLSVGEEGSVVISPYEGVDVVLEQKEGLLLNQGWSSFAMAPSEGTEREMDGPLVAVFRKDVRKISEISPAMEQASQWPGRGLVVFAPSVSGEALRTLILNDKKGVLSSVAVEYSGYPADLQDWLEDIVAVTNATLVDREAGLAPEDFDSSWLGYARKISVSRNKTLLISYMDEDILANIDRRVHILKDRAEKCPYPYDQDRLLERAASLDGGLATLRVGGNTKQEGQDRRSRTEDALRAVQTALRGGVVPGAGRTYFGASQELPPTVGGGILKSALQSILGVLVARSGLESSVVLAQGAEYHRMDLEGWWGYDPVSRSWRDFREGSRIVDPTEVAVSALRNAVSVACQIALCGGVVESKKR